MWDMGVGSTGESNRGKMDMTVIEQQLLERYMVFVQNFFICSSSGFPTDVSDWPNVPWRCFTFQTQKLHHVCFIYWIFVFLFLGKSSVLQVNEVFKLLLFCLRMFLVIIS